MFTSRNITENQTLENDLNTSSYVHYKEVGYNYVSAFLYLKDRSTLEQVIKLYKNKTVNYLLEYNKIKILNTRPTVRFLPFRNKTRGFE